MNAIARMVKWSYLEGDVRKGAPYPPCSGASRRAVCVYGLEISGGSYNTTTSSLTSLTQRWMM
ncbi:unnamed protein product [Coregonus sp. 'balchen']|nr:unnamed protein product [Coregonus sp. 'balchen']